MWCTGGLPEKGGFRNGVKTTSNATHIIKFTINLLDNK